MSDRRKYRCPCCRYVYRVPAEAFPIVCRCGDLLELHGQKAVTAQEGQPVTIVAPIEEGPGAELRAVIQGLDLAAPAGCGGCNSLMQEMNRLGVEGCRREYDRLLKSMRKNAKRFGWVDWSIAAMAALRNGIATEVNWIDPLPGLLNLAIQRAEQR